MTQHFHETIAHLENKLRDQEKAVVKTKTLINELCIEAGEAVRYSSLENGGDTGVPLSIQGDEFYGQQLATCIRKILEMRRALKQGPANINEIYAALVQGGYLFDTKNEENAKRGLRQSLTKNAATFHKLPNGSFGLLEWYPKVKGSKTPDADAMLKELAASNPNSEGEQK